MSTENNIGSAGTAGSEEQLPEFEIKLSAPVDPVAGIAAAETGESTSEKSVPLDLQVVFRDADAAPPPENAGAEPEENVETAENIGDIKLSEPAAEVPAEAPAEPEIPAVPPAVAEAMKAVQEETIPMAILVGDPAVQRGGKKGKGCLIWILLLLIIIVAAGAYIRFKRPCWFSNAVETAGEVINR